MIKLFRKIRQKLLSENKFTRYLVYASGEIILVVIGILIALGVNQQSQNKANEEKVETIFEAIYKIYPLILLSQIKFFIQFML